MLEDAESQGRGRVIFAAFRASHNVRMLISRCS